MPRPLAFASLIAAVCAVAAHDARGEEGWFVTAAGVRIETPAIAGLDCAGMRAVLDAIDASGYRRDAPQPHDEADMALFEYEHMLSSAHYAECVRPSAEDAPPETAFSAGYEAAGQ